MLGTAESYQQPRIGRLDRPRISGLLPIVALSVATTIILESSRLGFTLALASAVVLFAAALPGYRLLTGSFDLVEPAVYFLAYFCVDVIANLWYDLTVGSRLFNVGPQTLDAVPMVEVALSTVVLGLGAFYFGYSRRHARVLALRVPALPEEWDETRATVVLAMLAMSSVCVWGLMIYFGGGLFLWISEAKDQLLLGEHSGGIYSSLMAWELPALALSIVIIGGRLGMLRGVRSLMYPFFALAGLFGVFTGSRGWLPRLILAAFVASYTTSTSRSHWRSIRLVALGTAPLIVVIVLLFKAVTIIRFAGIGGATITQVSESMDDTSLIKVLAARFQALESLVWTESNVPRFYPYTLGYEFLDIPFMIVPRVIWPDKPESRDSVKISAAGTLGMEDPNWRDTYGYDINLLARLYLDGGVAVVILGMAITGFVFRFIYEYLALRPNPSGALVLSVVFPYFTGFADSDFYGLLTFGCVIFGIAIVVCATICKPRGRTSWT